MNFSLLSKTPIAYAFMSMLGATALSAQSASPDACYASKDADCLEAIFADILSEPTPEKSQAIYFLGLLQEESGDFAAAKKTYMMGVTFGGDRDAFDALRALFASNPDVFNQASDCLIINSDTCFETLIETGEGTAVRNAQYLYGNEMLARNPVEAVALLEASAEAGHGTSTCILQDFYRSGSDEIPADFHKSVVYGMNCYGSNPFPRLDTDHFAQYEATTGHRAYAFAETGLASYDYDVVDPNVAARLALEFCDTSPSRGANTPDCRVINIDGTWVDGPEPPSIPAFSGEIDGLIRVEALESYQQKYSINEGIKVFVQSKNGSWSWRASSEADATLEVLTQEAIANCENSWRARLNYPCEVININGEWVQ